MEISVGLDSFAAFAATWIDIYHQTAANGMQGRAFLEAPVQLWQTPCLVIPQLLYPAIVI
jgi:hypothetical protein